MNKASLIIFVLLAGLANSGLGQETGIPVRSTDPMDNPAPLENLPPAGLDIAVPEAELPGLPQGPARFDNSEIREMHRTVLSEIPRYPTLRLGDLSAYPFIHSSRNRYSGLDMAGIGTRVDITDWLSADVRAFLSGAYMGREYPKKYMNASAATTLRLKVHDRIYLLGTAEVSAREGLDPRVAPGIGGKNALGAGVEIWITDKLGFSVTRTWEHYRGSWYGHYGYGPISR